MHVKIHIADWFEPMLRALEEVGEKSIKIGVPPQEVYDILLNTTKNIGASAISIIIEKE